MCDSFQAGSLPADQAQAKTHVTPHQYAMGLSSCGHFYKFLYGPVVSYFNWSISNCSKLKTRKPKAFLLSDVWLFQDLLFPSWPSILGNSCYYTSPKCNQFIMLGIFLVLWPPASTVQPKVLLLGESIPGLFLTSWGSRVSSCTSHQCDGSLWRRIFV